MKKVNVLGVEFDNLTLIEFKKVFLQRIKDQKSTLIVTANPEIVMQANNDAAFMNLIKNDADFITADGIGIVLAG
ncbi:MAG: glycosyltransferase, partial [Lactobacillus iners]|nr:glycosyltransferase [Lactobacillus iners]